MNESQRDSGSNGDTTPTPSSQDSQSKKIKLGKNPFAWLMIAIVIPVMAIRESARALRNKTYNSNSGFPHEVAGILTALAVGIGAGYWQGWISGTSLAVWLSSGIAATLLGYFYGWPLAYLGVGKPIIRLSGELWDKVDRRNWFTGFLKGVARVAIFAGCAYYGWMHCLATSATLHAASWGILSCPMAIAWNGFLALLAGSFLWWAVTTTIQGLCLGSALLLGYAIFLPWSTARLAAFGLHSPAFAYGAAALEVVVYAAFAFPLIHIVGSHGLRFVRDFARNLYAKAYDHTVGEYEGVFVQLANIYTAYHLAILAPLGALAVGLTIGGWWHTALIALVGVLSYLYVGELMKAAGNRALGMLAGLHAAGIAGMWAWGADGVDMLLVPVIAAVAFALTYWLVYPLAYVIVRALTSWALNNEYAALLGKLHTACVDGAERLVKELAFARRVAYNDDTWFGTLFLQLANIVALWPVYKFSSAFLTTMAMTGWLHVTLLVLALVVSYLLVGKLLLWAKNVLVGFGFGLATAVAVGTYAFSVLPYAFWGALAGAVGLGLLGGAIVVVWVYPVAYVLPRFVLNIIDSVVPLFSKLVEPLFSGIYSFCWERVTGLWQQFRNTYRQVRAFVAPLWDSIAQMWNDAWQQVKDTWDSMTGGK